MTGTNEPRRGPAGEAQAADETSRIQDTTRRNLATTVPPQPEHVCRLADTFRAAIQDGGTFEYELGFGPELMQAALDAGFDLGWEPEDIMAALLQVRTEARRSAPVGPTRPGGLRAAGRRPETPPDSTETVS